MYSLFNLTFMYVGIFVAISVTRFGKIQPRWQKTKCIWAIFWIAYLVFAKLLFQLWHFYVMRQIVIVVNGQSLNSNLVTLVAIIKIMKSISISHQICMLCPHGSLQRWIRHIILTNYLPTYRPTYLSISLYRVTINSQEQIHELWMAECGPQRYFVIRREAAEELAAAFPKSFWQGTIKNVNRFAKKCLPAAACLLTYLLTYLLAC